MPRDQDVIEQRFAAWHGGTKFRVGEQPLLPTAAPPDADAPLRRSEVLALLEAQRLQMLEQVMRTLRERGVL